MNKIVFYCYTFSTILSLFITLKFNEYLDPGDIILISFAFSGLGFLLSLGFFLLKCKIEEKQCEEDAEFEFKEHNFDFEEQDLDQYGNN